MLPHRVSSIIVKKIKNSQWKHVQKVLKHRKITFPKQSGRPRCQAAVRLTLTRKFQTAITREFFYVNLFKFFITASCIMLEASGRLSALFSRAHGMTVVDGVGDKTLRMRRPSSGGNEPRASGRLGNVRQECERRGGFSPSLLTPLSRFCSRTRVGNLSDSLPPRLSFSLRDRFSGRSGGQSGARELRVESCIALSYTDIVYICM